VDGFLRDEVVVCQIALGGEREEGLTGGMELSEFQGGVDWESGGFGPLMIEEECSRGFQGG
jgi:hypothetical protein